RLVLADTKRFLTGHIGIRRYLGDSYFAPDYESKLSATEQTRDFSNDMNVRDALLEDIGTEAQWCLFDAILSAHHAARHKLTGSADDRALQVLHMNRALGQITDAGDRLPWRCPELYYLKEGEYGPGPHTPLLWSQANLTVALSALRERVRT